ncbi:hypothetical protein PMAYCL1PPCAC_09421 [Pristionchus mayeri]|uniref:Uncharacterized protein n=1 Tax=Pristionchus mayeri TaxID=1317129 RepID=A0AAN4ZED6_9BILA|nr:hypothetical protein PMAYCL1PPCAC_09421 [Pristionchus mayeri]
MSSHKEMSDRLNEGRNLKMSSHKEMSDRLNEGRNLKMSSHKEMSDRLNEGRNLTYELGKKDSSMGPVFQSAFDLLIALANVEKDPSRIGFALDSLDRQTQLHMHQDARRGVKVRETTYVYMARLVEVKKWERREVIRANMMRERMDAALKAANLPIPDWPTDEETDRRILFMVKGVKEEEPDDDDDMIVEVQSTSRKRRRGEGNMMTSPRNASNLAQEFLKRQREQNQPLAETTSSTSDLAGTYLEIQRAQNLASNESNATPVPNEGVTDRLQASGQESGSATSSAPSTSRPSESPSTSANRTKQPTHAEKEKHIPSSFDVPSTSVLNDYPPQENSAVNEVPTPAAPAAFANLPRPATPVTPVAASSSVAKVHRPKKRTTPREPVLCP